MAAKFWNLPWWKFIYEVRGLLATSRAPKTWVLGMFRVFGKIGHNLDQIWAWLPRGHRLAVGVRDPLKSSVTGPSLLVNCYLETKFHKKIRVNPPPPPPPLKSYLDFGTEILPNIQSMSLLYLSYNLDILNKIE